ncbi:hypothetical protein D5086_004327 [Populus alba]|uniref:Uncharacterized protein n=1 Tax=Populus alba TaxID=43335 RepID=A0ACC4CR69_POPAL
MARFVEDGRNLKPSLVASEIRDEMLSDAWTCRRATVRLSERDNIFNRSSGTLINMAMMVIVGLEAMGPIINSELIKDELDLAGFDPLAPSHLAHNGRTAGKDDA